MLDLNDIRVFVVVARHGTFRAAAGELHVPTSTIARAVTRLEAHLNCVLVTRSVRGILLTESGSEFLRTSKEALRTIKVGCELVQDRTAKPHGLLRVASPQCVNSLLVSILPQFLKNCPDVHVDLETYNDGYEQEPREDVDVFFKILPPADSNRRMHRFPSTLRGMFASRTYIQRSGSPASPEELGAHLCIGLETWKLTNGTETREITPPCRVTTLEPEVMLAMVLEGLGISILPLYMARQPGVSQELIQVMPNWAPIPTIAYALYYGSPRVPNKVKTFLDYVADFIGTERDPRIGRAQFQGLFGHRNEQ